MSRQTKRGSTKNQEARKNAVLNYYKSFRGGDNRFMRKLDGRKL